MRLVLDANVLVSGIFWRGSPHRLLNAWAKGRYELVASPPILTEYQRVIEELTARYGKADLAAQWLWLLAAEVALVSVKPRLQLSRDPADDMYLDCAVQGAADALVSGDKDLLVLGAVGATPILAPSEALKVIPR